MKKSLTQDNRVISGREKMSMNCFMLWLWELWKGHLLCVLYGFADAQTNKCSVRGVGANHLAIEVTHDLQRNVTTFVHGYDLLVRNWMKAPVTETHIYGPFSTRFLHLWCVQGNENDTDERTLQKKKVNLVGTAFVFSTSWSWIWTSWTNSGEPDGCCS